MKMKGYRIVSLDILLDALGESETVIYLSSYCNKFNKDVDEFLHDKAIEFSKQGLSKTHLVLASYQEKPQIAGYFTLANKNFSIKNGGNLLSKSLKGRIAKFANYDLGVKRYIISAPLIGQLGKNTNYPNLITGNELLKLACEEVKKVQAIVGGKIVYLECEDIDYLKSFYDKNGFVCFGKRQLDADEETNFKGHYLLQMLKYMH